MQEIVSVDQYAFNFRDELRAAAREKLSLLENLITSVGYVWLDSYMEGIMDSSTRAPLTELMKTPSRNATAKKTRATTVRAKEKVDKMMQLKATSPGPARAAQVQMFSPLQQRSLNVLQPASNNQSSPLKKAEQDKPKVKPKVRKGKGKKAEEPKAVVEPVVGEAEDLEIPIEMREPIPIDTLEDVVAVPTTQQPTLAAPIIVPTDLSMIAEGEEESSGVSIMPQVDEIEETAPVAESLTKKSPAAPIIAKKQTTAVALESVAANSILPPADVAVVSAPSRVTDAPAPVLEVTIERMENVKPTVPATVETSHAPVVAVEAAAAKTPASKQTKFTSPSPAATQAVAPLRSSPAALAQKSSPPPAPVAHVPHRAVRSSWLSKALGTGTVPISGLPSSSTSTDASSAYRTSFANRSSMQQTSDYAGLRKSLVPIGGLASKRKSDEVAEDERPEKIAKVETHPKTFAPTTSRLPASTVSLPPMAFTPSVPIEKINHSSQPPANPSNIYKVTRAMDELRERNMATQRAAQTTTGSGFLRGLLGRSFGGGMKSAEEEALRVEKELEEERRAEREAEEELEKLIGEKRTTVENEQSTTPTISPPTTMAKAEISPVEVEMQENEEDEEEEEEEFVEAAEIIRSTTPVDTPPRTIPAAVEAPPLHGRVEKHVHSSPAKVVQKVQGPVELKSRHVEAIKVDTESEAEDEEEEEEEEIEVEEDELSEDEVGDMLHKEVLGKPRSQLDSSTSAQILAASTSSTSTMFSQATTMAAKTLGIKPVTGPVKALQLAAAAAKKEQAIVDRKAYLKEQQEQRKVLAAKKKAEEDKVKADEDKKAKAAELEIKKKLKAEHDRKRKEREERLALLAKEKALREEKEAAAAAKAKVCSIVSMCILPDELDQAEEEASRKRKMAPMLNKSTGPLNPAKRIVPAVVQPVVKAKESTVVRPPIKMTPSTSTSQQQLPTKMGPTAFRTEPSQQAMSTITLVSQPQGERRPLGPPSRPSQLTGNAIRPPQPQAQRASTVLQQSRMTLQNQMAEVQSEDIVLPDIASEYSDSDDEDKATDFVRPAWAESPNLRQALENQATFNPDELFGPIKPLSMEDLFKVRHGKFRARSSSANWSGGDRLTEMEEREYVRKMGFKAAPSGSGSGSGLGAAEK
ncbi:hypothetical protein P7C73_g5630, partial [Tremellales sp. Uapishka_1]